MKASGFDRIKQALLGLIEGHTARFDFFAFYPARVAAQNADGTLEVQPDSAAVPPVSQVPIRLGVPGVKVKVAAGCRVLVGFEGGDPRRPVATLWQFDGPALLELAIGANPTSYVALATQTKAALDAIVSWANTHTHPSNGAPPATPLSTSTNVASTTTKST